MYYRPGVLALILTVMLALILLTLRRRGIFLAMHPEKRRTYDAMVAGFVMISAGLAVFLTMALKDGGNIEVWRITSGMLMLSGLVVFTVGWVDLLKRLSTGHSITHVVEFVDGGIEHAAPGLYLCISPDPGVIRELLTDRAGLIISRYPEDMAREKFGVERIPIFWLTKVAGKNTVNPRRLEYLTHIIVSFITKKEGPKTVLLEGVEYINVEVGFSALFKFLTIIKDYAVVNDAIVLVMVGEEAFPEKEWALLRREFPTLKEIEVR